MPILEVWYANSDVENMVTVKDKEAKRRGLKEVAAARARNMASAQDPQFLQIKEARRAVLKAYAGKSVYRIIGSGS